MPLNVSQIAKQLTEITNSENETSNVTNNMRTILSLIIASSLFLFSCNQEEYLAYSGMGKAPIYIPFSELDNIGSEAPRSIEQSGPIFLIGDFFFMVEAGKGIHIFDLSDVDQQNSIAFINIPAITDFTIDGNILFADSWKDLVSIDITDIHNVVFLSRTTDVFDPFLFPQLFNGPFECIDENRGAVIGWEDKNLENVFCHTVN